MGFFKANAVFFFFKFGQPMPLCTDDFFQFDI